MLKVSLCDYSNAYIIAKETIAVTNVSAQGYQNNGTNKSVRLKNCSPFTSYISRTNNTQVNDAQYVDVVMTMYNFIDYSDSYLKYLQFYGNIN